MNIRFYRSDAFSMTNATKKEEIAEIDSLIKQEAEKGYYQLVLKNRTLSSQTIKSLTSRSFKVSINEDNCIIDWDL